MTGLIKMDTWCCNIEVNAHRLHSPQSSRFESYSQKSPLSHTLVAIGSCRLIEHTTLDPRDHHDEFTPDMHNVFEHLFTTLNSCLAAVDPHSQRWSRTWRPDTQTGVTVARTDGGGGRLRG